MGKVFFFRFGEEDILEHQAHVLPKKPYGTGNITAHHVLMQQSRRIEVQPRREDTAPSSRSLDVAKGYNSLDVGSSTAVGSSL